MHFDFVSKTPYAKMDEKKQFNFVFVIVDAKGNATAYLED